MMEELFKALLSGGSQSQPQNSQQPVGDPLTDVLGAILGGASASQQSYQPQQYPQSQFQQSQFQQESNPYSAPASQQVAGDPLTDILGAILGGASQQAYQAQPYQQSQFQQSQFQQQAAEIPSAGGFASIINGILGGGSSNSLTSALAAPIAKALAEKFNLPPQIAQFVVTFVMGKLLSNAVGGPGASYAQAGGISNQGRHGGFELEDLLANMDGGQSFDTEYLQSTGMVDALSSRTGLNPELATQSMQEVFKMLKGQSDIYQR